jgi:hypothetical protein
MTDPALTTGQYSIGTPGSSSAFVYGGPSGSPTNGIYVADTENDTGSLNVQDQAIVGQDGLQFGVDTLPGMIVTQTGYSIGTPGSPSVMDNYGTLAGAWNQPSVRLANGSVQVLRAFYPFSSVIRRCYGRGRKIMPTMGKVYQGIVPFTAQFQAADGIWYSDTEYALVLTTVPSYVGGMTPPITPPLQLAPQTNTISNTIINTGPQPTWPVITFTGPITNPSIAYVSSTVTIGWTGTLTGPSDVLTIDTRPWTRNCVRNTQPAAGGLSGVPMTAMQIPPGSLPVSLGGQDPTGTATCTIKWRNAFLSIGGSQ